MEALTEKDVEGRTAVHLVAEKGSPEVIILNLIAHIIMVACVYTFLFITSGSHHIFRSSAEVVGKSVDFS